MAWYLEFTSGNDIFENMERTHTFPLNIDATTPYRQNRFRAKNVAKKLWQINKNTAMKEGLSYRNPQLVWKENL